MTPASRLPAGRIMTSGYRHALCALVEACVRHAPWVLLVAALATAACLWWTAGHLQLNTDTSDLLDPELPFRQRQLEFDRAFPQLSDNIVVVFESASRAAARDAAQAFADALAARRELFESVYLPGGGAFWQRHGLLYLDLDDLWSLADQLTDAQPVLGALATDPSLKGLFDLLGKGLAGELSADEQRLLGKVYDRISKVIEDQVAGGDARLWWRDELLAEDGGQGVQRTFLLVRPRLDFSSLTFAEGPLATVRRLARTHGLRADGLVRARITGSVAMENDELASVSRAASVATAVSFLLVCLLLFVAMWRAAIAVGVLVTLAVGLAWTGAFATATVGELNLISVSFAVLFIGLSVDFGIQLGLAVREALLHHADRRQALVEAARDMGGSLTLAAVAAAVSFLAFTPTHYRGLAELGIIAAGGMVLALIANLTVLPALLATLPLRPTRRAARLTIPPPPRERWRRPLLAVSVVATLGAAALLPRVEFDFNPLNMKDPSVESVQTFRDLLADPDNSPYTGEVLAPGLAQAEAIARRVERLREVKRAVTLSSFLPSDQDDKLAVIDDLALSLGPMLSGELGSGAAVADTAAEQAAIEGFLTDARHAQRATLTPSFAASVDRLATALTALTALPGWPGEAVAALHDRVINDLPRALDELRLALSAGPVSIDTLPASLVRRYRASDGRVRVEVFPAADLGDNRALVRFVNAVRAVAPGVTDTPVSLLEGGRAVIEASVQATLIAVAGVSALLLLTLRRIGDAVLVLVPLAMAVCLTGATTVLLPLPLNLGNIIAMPLLLGLGVAYGIYVMVRRRAGAPLSELYRGRIARAILFSALTTMASFGTLGFASHRGLATLGQLLVVALVFALTCALVTLPALIAEIDAHERVPRS